MTNKEYNEQVNLIADKVIGAMGNKLGDIEELDRQIIAAYLFGMINAYSMKSGATHEQVQAGVVAILNQRFGYGIESAVEFFFHLVKCTNKEYHPNMNIIICRGLDSYEDIDNIQKIRDEINRMIEILKEFTE